MNYKEFMQELQSYYGKYPKDSSIGNYVFAYLKRDITEQDLERLFRFLTYSHPVRYGLPGIAAIEKSMIDARRNNKSGNDPHKTIVVNTYEKLPPLTDDEWKRGEAGRKKMNGILKKAFSNKTVKEVNNESKKNSKS